MKIPKKIEMLQLRYDESAKKKETAPHNYDIAMLAN